MLDATTQVGNSSADADKGGKTTNKNKKDGVINCPYFSKICDFLTDKNVQGILGLIRNAWSVLWGSNNFNEFKSRQQRLFHNTLSVCLM